MKVESKDFCDVMLSLVEQKDKSKNFFSDVLSAAILHDTRTISELGDEMEQANSRN